MNFSGRLLDLHQPAVVENVCADHAIKIIVYERKVPHLMLDKGDVVDGSSLQPTFKRLEGCFGNVKGYNLKALFAEKYGMTTCPSAKSTTTGSGGEVSAHLCSLQASSQGCAFGITLTTSSV
jgi:hypothetical protein